jgi:hypothetical protein
MPCNCKCQRQSQAGGVYTYQCVCTCTTVDSELDTSDDGSSADQGKLANWLAQVQPGDDISGIAESLAKKTETDSTNYLRQQLNPDAATDAELDVDSDKFEQENPGATEALSTFLATPTGRAAQIQFPLHLSHQRPHPTAQHPVGGRERLERSEHSGGGEGVDYYRLYKKYKRKYKQLG